MIATVTMNELDGISRLLGNIESNITDLTHRFDRLERRMDDRDETLSDIQHTLGTAVEDTRYLKKALIEDIKPVTDDVRRWRLMGMGALAIVGVGGAALGSALLWVWDNVLNKFKLP